MYIFQKNGKNLYKQTSKKEKGSVYMEVRHMKNMVILKDLPSNMIEEAFVVLKENQRIHKMVDTANKEQKKEKNQKLESKTQDYVIKEAELIIQEYVEQIEVKEYTNRSNHKQFMQKYKKMKAATIFFSMFSLLSVLSILLR